MTPRDDLAPGGPVGLVRRVLAVSGVLLFYTNVDHYAFLAHGGPRPSRLIVLFVAGAAACVLASGLSRPLPLLRSPLLPWIGAYLFVTTLWAMGTSLTPVVVQTVYDRYRSMAFLITFALLFSDRRARRDAAVALALAVAAAAALNVLEALQVVQFAYLDDTELPRVPGRAGGLYVNPNRAGLAIACGLAVSVFGVPRRWRLPLIILSAAGVAATFSRGAATCLSLVIGWVLLRGTVVSRRVLLAGAAACALALYAGGPALTRFLEAEGVLNENTWARLTLSPAHEGVASRANLAELAWSEFLEAPLAGHGLAASLSWGVQVSSHNTYLNLAVDHGVLGLLLFPALGLAMLATRRAGVFPLLFLTAGLFSHNMLQERYVLLAVALATAGAEPAAAARRAMASREVAHG